MSENNNNSPEWLKMALLAKSIQDVQDKEDGLVVMDDNIDDALDELKAAAFEALLLNPGSEFGDWQQILIEDYPSEVVDAYGCNPPETMALLSDLWDTPYEDTASGLEYTFETWAQCFCTEASVQMYYDIIEKLKK